MKEVWWARKSWCNCCTRRKSNAVAWDRQSKPWNASSWSRNVRWLSRTRKRLISWSTTKRLSMTKRRKSTHLTGWRRCDRDEWNQVTKNSIIKIISNLDRQLEPEAPETVGRMGRMQQFARTWEPEAESKAQDDWWLRHHRPRKWRWWHRIQRRGMIERRSKFLLDSSVEA